MPEGAKEGDLALPTERLSVRRRQGCCLRIDYMSEAAKERVRLCFQNNDIPESPDI